MVRELLVACLFLTRLPVRVEGNVTMRELAAGTVWFPLIGALIGLVGALAFYLAGLLGLSSFPAAILSVLAMILLTGALHEDGLADTADALGAGPDRARALEIMRDSTLGAFGVIAIVLILMTRVSIFSTLWEPLEFGRAIVAAAAFSRGLLPAVMHFHPPARETGLAASAGRPEAARAAAALGIGTLLAMAMLPSATGLLAVLVGGGMGSALAGFARRRFGGYTGDTLGAIQQLAEVTMLLVVIARV